MVRDMKKTVFINLFVGIVTFLAWIYMAFFSQHQVLASNGWSSLRFFTVLSNLLNGAVSLCSVWWTKQNKEITTAKKVWKLTATASVGLTFLTVAVFLGPLYGYELMFNGANFWFHLVLPVLSMVSYMFFEKEFRLSFRYTFFAVLAPFFYSVGYVGNLLVNGVGEWPDRNDFYGFVTWGVPIAGVIALSVYLMTWGIAVVLNRVNAKKEWTNH